MPKNSYNTEANQLLLLKLHKKRFWFSIPCGSQDEGCTCSVKPAAVFHTGYTLEWPVAAENPPTRVERKCKAFDSTEPSSIPGVFTILSDVAPTGFSWYLQIQSRQYQIIMKNAIFFMPFTWFLWSSATNRKRRAIASLENWFELVLKFIRQYLFLKEKNYRWGKACFQSLSI